MHAQFHTELPSSCWENSN